MGDISRLSDEEVVVIVREAEREVYAEIIKRYQAKLMRYARSITDDEQLGADAVQESFIKAYINLNSFDKNRKFSSWIYRIVHNEAMNLMKKNRKQRPIGEDEDFQSDLDLEDEAIKNELINHTHQCLSQIQMKYKEPLTLFFLEEKSYEEISDILRIPVGTVGTRINRAKGIMNKLCLKYQK